MYKSVVEKIWRITRLARGDCHRLHWVLLQATSGSQAKVWTPLLYVEEASMISPLLQVAAHTLLACFAPAWGGKTIFICNTSGRTLLQWPFCLRAPEGCSPTWDVSALRWFLSEGVSASLTNTHRPAGREECLSHLLYKQPMLGLLPHCGSGLPNKAANSEAPRLCSTQFDNTVAFNHLFVLYSGSLISHNWLQKKRDKKRAFHVVAPVSHHNVPSFNYVCLLDSA